jgi:hypothetical protein
MHPRAEKFFPAVTGPRTRDASQGGRIGIEHADRINLGDKASLSDSQRIDAHAHDRIMNRIYRGMLGWCVAPYEHKIVEFGIYCPWGIQQRTER